VGTPFQGFPEGVSSLFLERREGEEEGGREKGEEKERLKNGGKEQNIQSLSISPVKKKKEVV